MTHSVRGGRGRCVYTPTGGIAYPWYRIRGKAHLRPDYMDASQICHIHTPCYAASLEGIQVTNCVTSIRILDFMRHLSGRTGIGHVGILI